MTPGNGASFSVCQSFFSVQWHSLSHKFWRTIAVTSDTLPTNLLTHHFLKIKKMHNVRKKLRTLSRLVHFHTMHACSKMQNKIVLLQPRWSSLETPGTSSRAFPNSLNFVTSINKSQTKNLFVKRVVNTWGRSNPCASIRPVPDSL